jgi:hypothetical protein
VAGRSDARKARAHDKDVDVFGRFGHPQNLPALAL